MTIMRNK